MPPRPPPELTPDLFLSYEGLRELEAARAEADWDAGRRPVPAALDEISFEQELPSDVEIQSLIEMMEQARADDPDYSSFTRREVEPISEEDLEYLRGEPVAPDPVVREIEIANNISVGRLQEIGRVGREGRFPILVQPSGHRQEPRSMSAFQRDMAAAKKIAEQERQRQREAMHETLPTCYDRLMGEDPFDDDLE
jgi:hypothetical protein